MKDLYQLYKRAYAKPYVFIAIFAIAFMFIDVSITLIIPSLTKNIINEGVNNADLAYVTRMGIFVIGIAIAAVIFTIGNNISTQYLSSKITADIRKDLFKKVQELSFNNIDQISTGKLITTISNDTLQIQQILAMSFRILLRAPIMLIGAIILAYRTNADMFIIIVIVVPIIILGFVLIFYKAAPLFKQMQKRIDNLNSKLLESVSGAREIKSFVTMDQEEEMFEKANEAYHESIVKANKVVSVVNPMIILITNIAMGAIIFLGGYLTSIYSGPEAADMIGVVMTYLAYIMNVVFALMMLSMIFIFFSRAAVSAERINTVLHTVVDIQSNENAITDFVATGNIRFEDVSFSYVDEEGKSDGVTLQHINLEIHAAETIGIIGSTGSGKTTFVQLLPRLYEVTSGAIYLDDINIKDLDINVLRAQISYVTQEAIIFEGTIAENIYQGKKDASEAELEEAARLAVADEYIERFDQRFHSHISQEGVSLSGGQKQRLSLARAFVRKPKILILDDSTSAVDAKSEAKIKENIKSLGYKPTTLIVAQKISTVKDCDRIICLNNKGQIDGFASHEALLEISQVYKEIFESQMGGLIDER